MNTIEIVNLTAPGQFDVKFISDNSVNGYLDHQNNGFRLTWRCLVVETIEVKESFKAYDIFTNLVFTPGKNEEN